MKVYQNNALTVYEYDGKFYGFIGADDKLEIVRTAARIASEHNPYLYKNTLNDVLEENNLSPDTELTVVLEC